MKKIIIREKSFNVSDNNLLFWDKVLNNKWEKDTFNIFDRFLNKDTVYFDIGAWIGPTVLYAAQLSKFAYAFEPDPVAFNVLKSNLDLNENREWHKKVNLLNKAAGAENGYINIGSRSSGGDSLSSALFTDDATQWKVETIKITDFIDASNLKNERIFFKIDIEGGEYSLIPSMIETLSDQNNVLFLSFHPGIWFDSIIKNNRSFPGKVSGWLKVIRAHFGILKTLPFKYFYLQSGRMINSLNLLYYTVRLRSFSIIAVNEPWA